MRMSALPSCAGRNYTGSQPLVNTTDAPAGVHDREAADSTTGVQAFALRARRATLGAWGSGRATHGGARRWAWAAGGERKPQPAGDRVRWPLLRQAADLIGPRVSCSAQAGQVVGAATCAHSAACAKSCDSHSQPAVSWDRTAVPGLPVMRQSAHTCRRRGGLPSRCTVS